MTTNDALNAAIAAVKGKRPRSNPWNEADFTDEVPFNSHAARNIATILNAVVSGQLVPADRGSTDMDAAPNDAMSESWREYEADFNNMTDEEIEREREISQDLVDEHEGWLEAVALWDAAGKPRSSEAREATA